MKTDYDRILRELKINRVNPNMIRKYQTDICGNLGQAADRDCPAAIRSMADLEAAFRAKSVEDAKKVFEQTRNDYATYYNRLYDAMSAMQQMATLKQIIALLEAIDRAETKQIEQLEKLRKQMEDEIFNKLGK